MKKNIVIAALLGSVFGVTVGYSAANFSVPHTFVAGTAIKASEVNENFAAVTAQLSALTDKQNAYRAPNYAESSVAPVSATVGTVVPVVVNGIPGTATVFQLTNIKDDFTDKTYDITYAAHVEGASVLIRKCDSDDRSVVVRKVDVNGIAAYIRVSMPTSNSPTAGISAQITPTLCLDYPLLMNRGTAGIQEAIDIANIELKYLSVTAK